MDEQWEIIDENEKPTGEIVNKKDPRAYQEGVYHLAADLWILNSENKLLIQKRSKNKKYEPNVWAMTGGNVILGEDPKDTLKREFKEELDIDLNLDNLECFTKVKTNNAIVREYFTRQDYDTSKMKFKDLEVTEVKWATWEEIDYMAKNKEFISNRWEFVSSYLKSKIDNIK